MNRHRAGRFITFASAVAVAVLAGVAARAAPPARKGTHAASPADQAAAVQAREYFERGEAFFKLEKYKEALEQYEQGYLAKADASFLYNIAQCHRLMGDKPAALRFYKRFLNEATHVPNRPVVEQHIKELEASLSDEAPIPAAPPPEPLPTAPEPAAATPALVAQATPASPPSRGDQPIYKKWWFWTIVGAVAIGGGVGAFLATRSSSSGCEAGRVCM